MQLVDRIEKRRFLGREFVLWLWFESEVLDSTFESKAHGTFGLWVEKEIVLSAAKEVTSIKGQTPAHAREAKEALRLGKLPAKIGLHLALGDRESTFMLKAETLGISGLRLPTVLGEEPDALTAMGPGRMPKRGKKTNVAEDAESASDKNNEAFFERMHFAREVEELLEELYRTFLTLRLSPHWNASVTPALQRFCEGTKVDADAYRALRKAAQAGTKKRA